MNSNQKKKQLKRIERLRAKALLLDAELLWYETGVWRWQRGDKTSFFAFHSPEAAFRNLLETVKTYPEV